MKRLTAILLLLTLMFAGCAAAENVINMPYTCPLEQTLYDGVYTGECDNGLPEGFGLFIAMKNGTALWHYIGLWENGLPEGEGTVYHEDGRVEKGTFKGGVLQNAPLMIAAVSNNTASPQYIGNVKTRAFHRLTCPSVNEMKTENKVPLSSREEAISQGYHPCGRCKP